MRPKHRRGLFAFLIVVGVIVPTAISSGATSLGSAGFAPLGASHLLTPATKVPLLVSRTASQINAVLPNGIPDAAEPSGQSPPGPNSFPGSLQSYVSDFGGSALPSGWQVFTGSPDGDPSGQWSMGHVVVSDGLLHLNAFQDPQYNGAWVTGGLCQCGVARTYGSYFVRSRLTGPGPTQVELLWPAVGWPPEIDFNETYGTTGSSMATDHYTSANLQVHRTVNVDMTQWHTWGVVWTPTTITYTVDGRVWGMVTEPAAIPSQPMTLDLQQQTWCGAGWACPTTDQSTLVDWVVEYTPSVHQSAVVGPFNSGSTNLLPSLRSQVTTIARQIRSNGNPLVTLVGFGDSLAPTKKNATIGHSRARAVEAFLRLRLGQFGVRGVRIVVSIGATGQLGARTAPGTPSNLDKVVVTIN